MKKGCCLHVWHWHSNSHLIIHKYKLKCYKKRKKYIKNLKADSQV